MGNELISWAVVSALLVSVAFLIYDLLIRTTWESDLRWRRIVPAGVVYAVSWLVLAGFIQIN